MVGYHIKPSLGNGFVVTVVLNSVIMILMIVLYCFIRKESTQGFIRVSSMLLAITQICLLICEFDRKSVLLNWIAFIMYCLMLFVFVAGCLPCLFVQLYEVLPIIYHSQYLGVIVCLAYLGCKTNYLCFALFKKLGRAVCFCVNLVVYSCICVSSFVMMDYSIYSVENVNMLLGYFDLYVCSNKQKLKDRKRILFLLGLYQSSYRI